MWQWLQRMISAVFRKMEYLVAIVIPRSTLA